MSTTVQVVTTPEALLRMAIEERFHTSLGAIVEAEDGGKLPEPASTYIARWLDEHGYAIVPKQAAAAGAVTT